jgi:hypothetical protein
MAMLNIFELVPTQLDQPVSLLELDIDPESERLLVMSRSTLEVLYFNRSNGAHKVVMPIEYGTLNDLIVMILDDEGQYNAAVLDGVMASVVNLSEV